MEQLHVRYEYDEAISGKKDLLIIQSDLIKSIKKLQAYKALRLQELKKKQELKSKLSELANKINILNKVMPKAKTPKIEQDELISTAEVMKKTDLEHELYEIQEKLAQLDDKT